MVLGFTKKESIFISAIIFVLVSVTLVNLSSSYRKSRDNVRKDALGDIETRLGQFKIKYGFYPEATADGKILGCDGFVNPWGKWIFKECAWGPNPVNSLYLDPLPTDPYAKNGWAFAYFSNGEAFQIYTSFEGQYEDEFSREILARNIKCGAAICNAGRSNAGKPTLFAPLPSPKAVSN